MEKSYSESYAAAGVDITAGYRSVELMKQYVARTMNEHCIGGLGGFGGLFELDCTGYKHPVLISGTDGVGTKLKIAMILDKHDTIGIDCVAMCVNDVICAGAKPLVFLDYIACGRNIPEKIAEIVKGVAEGCVQADCSLVGGETAEHPGMMPEEEYDLAGFTVGVVDKEKILNNDTMKPGDVILALPSTGVHSNGFSLVRKIFDIDGNPDILKTAPAELGGKTLGEALLAPTKIHVKPGKGAAFVRTKMKNIITGGVTETSFNPTAKFEQAFVERKDMEYSYNDGDLYYFMDMETYDMLPISKDLLGDSFKFVKENMTCKVMSYKGSVFGVEPPNFVELEVTETDPGFKGDTATNVTKPATLETGAEIKVPLFINPGDKIKIDTRTGEYLERCKG